MHAGVFLLERCSSIPSFNFLKMPFDEGRERMGISKIIKFLN
jgi:hypothetical protein